MRKWLKDNYRHLICGGFVTGSGVLTAFRYRECLFRIGESFVDLWHSLQYYFFFLIGSEAEIDPTVLSVQNIELSTYFGFDYDELMRKLQAFPRAFFSWENFSDYLLIALEKTVFFLNFLVLLIPLVLIGWRLFKDRILQPNTDHNVDSRPMRRYREKISPAIGVVKNWGIDFYRFVADRPFWWGSAALIWAVNLNLFGIIVSAFAFYFYFAASIDFFSIISTQLVKLLIDLVVTFSGLPFVFWLAGGYFVFDLIRRSIGFRILEAHEAANRAFLESLPLVIFLNGTMGSKKTTTITDMALSYEIMFRNKAFEMLLDRDLMFPNFPWINLEMSIVSAMEKHQIFNLASIRKYMRQREKKFRREPTSDHAFGYRIDLFPQTFRNGLQVLDLWDVLTEYACLYFIYSIESSLLVSNYSVRVDNVLRFAGNFPLWDTELFRRKPELQAACSRHAHILDFDVLRISRQVVEDNRNAGSFEFGVVLITEIDKERGNQIKLQGVDRNSFETNQRNDNFNYSFKMGRHPSTVGNYPFFRVLLDAQRPMAWEADGRELATELFSKSCSKRKISMPFFTLLDWFDEWILARFTDFYTEYRFQCGDNKLSVYLLHNLVSAISARCTRIRNTFGYMESSLEVRDGLNDESVGTSVYYLSTVKVYSDRFATDCYREFFAAKSLASRRGIEDYPEYQKTCATLDELHRQNSYFIRDMEGMTDEKE